MALYVYNVASGALVSWCPGDTDPVASDSHLAANGLAVVTGLPAIDATHAWDTVSKTIVVVAAPIIPRLIITAKWILRFTAAEFSAISASTDPVVLQFMYALNHTTDLDLNDPSTMQGVNYMVSIGLLQSARVAAIMA